MTCPHCAGTAGYHDDRPRKPVSLFGTVRFERAYYYCRRCGTGTCPFDQRAGISERNQTPAVERLATLGGAVADSFAKGAELLYEMAHVKLSESTVERTTEDVGARIAEHLEQGITYGPDTSWAWHHDALGRTVAYATIDATGTRQQAADGGPAEGRMAYVAGIYNPNPCQEPRPANQPDLGMPARYVSGLYELAEVGPLLRRQAKAVGMDQAEVWIGLTDGGAGLESFLQTNFNRADLVLILDFYHAASYLEKLAQALHPGDEDLAKAQGEQWCRLLKEEGGAATLAVLEQWLWPARRSAGLRSALSAVESYYGNNVHRMEYPEYTAWGWQIGSGVVESACKTVVGQRLKGAGMRWSEAGAHQLCHVRALYRSEKGQWQAFWKRQFTSRTPVQQLM